MPSPATPAQSSGRHANDRSSTIVVDFVRYSPGKSTIMEGLRRGTTVATKGSLVLEPAVTPAIEEQRAAAVVRVQVVHAAHDDDVIPSRKLAIG